MNLIELDIVDWEPCVLRFIFPPDAFPVSQVRGFVETWLKERPAQTTCGCTHRYADFVSDVVEGTETLRAEWLCKVCAQVLADAVQREFPNLRKVELGLRGDGRSTKGREFIHIPAKEVEFEDRKRVAVASFSIASRPVTLGEFEDFVHTTGYLTLAEKRGSSDTFRHHCGLSGLSAMARKGVPVQFIALADAQAFCKHVGFRLPTEAEWLAGAVLASNEIELTAWEELQMRSRPTPANALEVSNWDITSTGLPDGRLVARRGPLHFLKNGWREQPLLDFNRRFVSNDYFDISITFRLAKDN